MEDFERELKSDFLAEATSLMEESESYFLDLESDPNNPELMNAIFRIAHNVKGTSRAVGFGEIAEFTHEFENLILKIKNGGLEITSEIVSVLLKCNDHLHLMIETLNNNMEAIIGSDEIIKEIIAASEGRLVSSAEEVGKDENETEEELEEEIEEEISNEIEPEIEIEEPTSPLQEETSDNFSFETMDHEDEEALNAAILREIENQKEIDKKAVHEEKVVKKEEVLPITLTEKKEPEPEKQNESTGENKSQTKKEDIRVSLDKVEMLNDIIGELVILHTVLKQRSQKFEKDELMEKSLNQLGKLSKEIQGISMSLRMLPIKPTMQKMQRIIRDTSKLLKKEVNLTLIGEETEVDKTVLTKLADPLVHIVRNAIDHGLELPDERVAKGKTPHGNVSIRSAHEGNNLVIEIVDDGKGIDANIIKEKAIAKGLIPKNSSLPDNDIVQLIFHPGFSTKDQVSEVSGRGVGMDVVKTNIESMGGRVLVNTQINKGSVFRIELPLTMAIIDALVFRVNDERFIVPLGQIQESLRPTSDMIKDSTSIGECLKIRGQVLPLKRVADALKLKSNKEKSAPEEMLAVIIHTNKHPIAILVDDILHQQQVVIKKIGSEIKNNKGFMGSAILGDGKPAFILDIHELFADIINREIKDLNNILAA